MADGKGGVEATVVIPDALVQIGGGPAVHRLEGVEDAPAPR
jgi:hypothetical protein